MHDSSGHHHQHQSESESDADRTNRFLTLHHHNHNNGDSPSSSSDAATLSLRERAASQPPRSGHNGLLSSLYRQSSYGGSGSPWATSTQSRRFSPSLSPVSFPGSQPQSVPTRSSSFSTSPAQSHLASVMRDYRGFPSTFEDDESEALSDTYDERFIPPSLANPRGRTIAQDISRSRSQSLAATRAPPGSSFPTHLNGTGWNEAGMSPTGISNGFSPRYEGGLHVPNRQSADISNMSPFMRDVGQILLDDGSAFRELWSGMHPPRDENGGGGSGTTSRRHSVSVVQPRRGIVGFSAEEANRPPLQQHQSSFVSGGGLLLTDDDLASSLNMLSLGQNGSGHGHSSSSDQPVSQPSSLPIYAPLSRHPSSTQDRMSPYQPMNLNIQTGSSFSSRQILRSPSESGFSGGGSSPPTRHSQFDGADSAYFSPGGTTHRTIGDSYMGSPTFHHRPSFSSSALQTPVSPTSSRTLSQGQQVFFAQPLTRRVSNAEPPPNMNPNDLGKGVPLSSVPASCPLYIVEFKAGRTDLFYCTDLSLDIRVGDLVIVEADRGKDLGKVVNDSITLKEVEAFQQQQQHQQHQASLAYGDTSPTGGAPPPTGGGKKELNPKMILGKAQPQDTQLLVTKIQDEVKALQLCQTKVRQKKLPMEVIDAEYQWDRRKLTFYFVADKRIDFRELVRELFRLYKTRIWMASLGGPNGYEQ